MAKKFEFRWLDCGEEHVLQVQCPMGLSGSKLKLSLNGAEIFSVIKMTGGPHIEIISVYSAKIFVKWKVHWFHGALETVEIEVNDHKIGQYIPGFEVPRIDNAANANIGNNLGPVNASDEPMVKQPDRVITKEKVIERQVMVTRCKFCGQITPLDLNNCEKCGAAAFS
jgi:hypothetical protein